MKPITYHRPLGSSMALLSNMTKKNKLIRMSDILRAKRTKAKVTQIVRDYRAKIQAKVEKNNPARRVGFVQRMKAGFNITGFGQTGTMDFTQVHAIGNENGFTHFRLGNLVVAVEKLK